VFQVQFHEMPEIVAAGTALDPGTQPVVKLEQLASENPESWTDVTTDITLATPGVVDAVDEDGNVLLANGAVQFVITGEVRTDPPLPGDNYSFLVKASRADDPTLEVSARAWLRIMP
jgi:hypothetical protein